MEAAPVPERLVLEVAEARLPRLLGVGGRRRLGRLLDGRAHVRQEDARGLTVRLEERLREHADDGADEGRRVLRARARGGRGRGGCGCSPFPPIFERALSTSAWSDERIAPVMRSLTSTCFSSTEPMFASTASLTLALFASTVALTAFQPAPTAAPTVWSRTLTTCPRTTDSMAPEGIFA